MSLDGRRTPLRRVSRKRAATLAERRAVVAAVRRRAHDRCEGWRYLPDHDCRGPLDAHELAARSARPGGELDPENIVLICRSLHDWCHEHPEEALAAGLRRPSWDTRSVEEA